MILIRRADMSADSNEVATAMPINNIAYEMTQVSHIAETYHFENKHIDRMNTWYATRTNACLLKMHALPH